MNQLARSRDNTVTELPSFDDEAPRPSGDGGGGGGSVGPVIPPTPTTPGPTNPGTGVTTATSRRANLDALDNVGVSAGEADVDVASDGSDAELDPSTGRRRPTRASFMSQRRGGAGLKV